MIMTRMKTLKEQLIDIKGRVSTILSKELLFDFEEEVLNEIYDLVTDIMLDNIHDKRYSTEEIVDTRIMEYVVILENSTNRNIKRLVKVLMKGLNW